MKVGDPVPLDDLRALPHSQDVINRGHRADHGRAHRSSSRSCVARSAPAERFDPRAKGLSETGDFHQPERKKRS